jgi:hypothetical protein
MVDSYVRAKVGIVSLSLPPPPPSSCKVAAHSPNKRLPATTGKWFIHMMDRYLMHPVLTVYILIPGLGVWHVNVHEYN